MRKSGEIEDSQFNLFSIQMYLCSPENTHIIDAMEAKWKLEDWLTGKQMFMFSLFPAEWSNNL
jgi:hypothetical protein